MDKTYFDLHIYIGQGCFYSQPNNEDDCFIHRMLTEESLYSLLNKYMDMHKKGLIKILEIKID